MSLRSCDSVQAITLACVVIRARMSDLLVLQCMYICIYTVVHVPFLFFSFTIKVFVPDCSLLQLHACIMSLLQVQFPPPLQHGPDYRLWLGLYGTQWTNGPSYGPQQTHVGQGLEAAHLLWQRQGYPRQGGWLERGVIWKLKLNDWIHYQNVFKNINMVDWLCSCMCVCVLSTLDTLCTHCTAYKYLPPSPGDVMVCWLPQSSSTILHARTHGPSCSSWQPSWRLVWTLTSLCYNEVRVYTVHQLY